MVQIYLFLKQCRQYAVSFLFNAPLPPSAAAVTGILYLHTKPESRIAIEHISLYIYRLSSTEIISPINTI